MKKGWKYPKEGSERRQKKKKNKEKKINNNNNKRVIDIWYWSTGIWYI